MQEIERKWLLKSLPQTFGSDLYLDKELSIHQYYKNDLRYRVTKDIYNVSFPKYERIKKMSLSPGINVELDVTEIDIEEFNANRTGIFITKIRRVYREDKSNLRYEVDQFHRINLIVLEVELPDINYEFDFPKSISKEIIIEVTKYKEFSNRSLAKMLK